MNFSLNPDSNGAKVLDIAKKYILANKMRTQLIDLKKYNVPFCNGTQDILSISTVQELISIFDKNNKILIACPIYNHDVNAVFKNFVDILSIYSANKKRNNHMVKIAFIFSMGSLNSYLSAMPSINYLNFFLGYKVLPNFVMCSSQDIADGNISKSCQERLVGLLENLINN